MPDDDRLERRRKLRRRVNATLARTMGTEPTVRIDLDGGGCGSPRSPARDYGGDDGAVRDMVGKLRDQR